MRSDVVTNLGLQVVVLITVVNGIYILSDDDSAALRRKLELEHDHELHPHRNMTNSAFAVIV